MSLLSIIGLHELAIKNTNPSQNVSRLGLNSTIASAEMTACLHLIGLSCLLPAGAYSGASSYLPPPTKSPVTLLTSDIRTCIGACRNK
jgi:hypothetical protein